MWTWLDQKKKMDVTHLYIYIYMYGSLLMLVYKYTVCNMDRYVKWYTSMIEHTVNRILIFHMIAIKKEPCHERNHKA